MQPVRTFILLFAFSVLALANPVSTMAQDTPEETIQNSSSFFPVWRLLSSDEKRQFVAGYLKGWQDAATVTDIVITYIREHPENTIDGLQRIRQIYDLNNLKPDIAATAIDEFYANPENQNAALSVAVTAARNARQ